MVKAVACELVAETKQPLSRQSLADVTARAQQVLAKPLSRSTVWRILQTDAIKPWRYKYWIFPRDPCFAEKAGPILDLYTGTWHGQPLGPKDHILRGAFPFSRFKGKAPVVTKLPPSLILPGCRKKSKWSREYEQRSGESRVC